MSIPCQWSTRLFYKRLELFFFPFHNSSPVTFKNHREKLKKSYSGKECRKNVKGGRHALNYCPLDLAWLSYPGTHRAQHDLHKTHTRPVHSERQPHPFTEEQLAADSFWKRDTLFFFFFEDGSWCKSYDSVGGLPITHAQMSSANWT